MAERDCPVCPFTPMVEADSGKGFSVDECPECGGRWYDAGELCEVVAEGDKLREYVYGGELDKPKASERICPICKQRLSNGGLVNPLLRVDFCKHCRGFWLDKPEIGLLDRLLK